MAVENPLTARALLRRLPSFRCLPCPTFRAASRRGGSKRTSRVSASGRERRGRAQRFSTSARHGACLHVAQHLVAGDQRATPHSRARSADRALARRLRKSDRPQPAAGPPGSERPPTAPRRERPVHDPHGHENAVRRQRLVEYESGLIPALLGLVGSVEPRFFIGRSAHTPS